MAGVKNAPKLGKAEQLQWIVGLAIFLGALLSFLPLGAGAADADEKPSKSRRKADEKTMKSR